MTGRLPLSRFRVLDLTQHRAGPTAVRQLADWGADVLKIEIPGSGEEDALGGSRDGPDFQNLHRNKRAMTLNLKSPEGHDIFMRLAKDADVIVENMRSDVKHRLGVDYEAVRKINPRIVYGSISGFGQDGPYATRRGVDQIAQGMGGLMSITGEPGRGPMRVGIAVADTTSGIFLSQAILLALLDREVTGEGQWVHTSLLEAEIFILDFQAARWTMMHEVPGQAGNHHPTSAPSGVFKTGDGYVNIAATTAIWPRLCKAIGAPELTEDKRFRTPSARSDNRDALADALAVHLGRNTTAHWDRVLNEAGVPTGPILTLDQTFADPQVKHLRVARPVDHPRIGTFEIVGQPIHLEATPQPDRLRPAPDAGQHTDETLGGLGFTPGEIADLRARGIV